MVDQVDKTSATKKRILLVDDELNLTKMLCMLLETRGYTVQVAFTAAESLQKVSEGFDLILLDLVLPDFNGLEVCRKLKQEETTRHIPIIMMSAHSLHEDKVEALYLGADDFLAKPCEHEELVARMEAVMRRSIVRDVDQTYQKQDSVICELRRILDESLIIPYFQPIYLLNPLKVYGVEVLARPITGSVLANPEIFFKVALQYGMYTDLEMLSWSLALKRVSKLIKSEKIFLNCNPYFVESSKVLGVCSIFANNGILPQNVTLEITERSAVTDFKLFYAQLHEYRQAGFNFAVDDVGGGYASLESIVETRPEVVKIDSHIIRDLHKNSYKKSIVKFIVSFCRENGILSVAEGIETKDDLQAAQELGVDAGQGYYLFRPTSKFDLAEFQNIL